MRRGALAILFVTLFVDLLGFGLIVPLIPIYIRHYGGAPWVGGLLMASFSMMQFVFAPVWGRLSDRVGRRPLILLSLVGSGVSYWMFGAAPNLAVLFAARVASGILTAASLPTAQAYVADVTPPERRAGGMALLGAAFGLGFAFGPWIGGVLGRYALPGYPAIATPAFFASGLALVSFLFALFLLPETHHDRRVSREREGPLAAFVAVRNALRRPGIGAALLVFAFANFAFAAVESSFSWLVILRFEDRLAQMAAAAWEAGQHTSFAALSPEMRAQLTERMAVGVSGGIFGIVGVTVLIAHGAVMGGLARRVGEAQLVIAGVAVLTLALLGVAFAQDLNAIRVLSACIALGSGVMGPSLTALITQYADSGERGTVSGAQHGLSSLARILAPPVNNYLVGWNTAVPFVAASALMGVALALSLRLRPGAVREEGRPAVAGDPSA
ncbi:MAG: MFS transporter [Chloroherpetonaceae bacterium]|nr:MFS transporter [Chthonomonadaceae bacterium]MDW8206778.1 MFS transporter [Chloroherpetonaceae bacterium]